MLTWITKWSFKNKAALGLIVVMALLFGWMSYNSLPMEFMPEADNPQVTVTVIGPGQNAKSMEENVTKPIEEATSFVKGKKEILSTSGDGYAQINIYFESKTNMKEATREVKEAIDPLQYPQGVLDPFVLQLNTSMIPISQIAISFEDGLTEQNIGITEEKILPELQKLKGVSNVELYGRPTSQVSITADPHKMALNGIGFQSFMSFLQGSNISASIGEQTIDGETGNVNIVSTVDSIDTLQKLPLSDGVALGDVASVELRHDFESIGRVNGQEMILAIVMKEANANAVDVGDQVKEKITELTERYDNAIITDIFSSSEMVVTSVNSMMREVLLGALFATLVILLFLRNFRATLITVISIPLSLAVTLYLLHVSGVTLNIITLGGVAVAVGRLVDDSIVVIENIYRRMGKECLSAEMVIDATREVAKAITASTITTVAVFLPMGLLKGSLQDFLLPFALTITYSLLTSLLVALTVVPLLSSWLLKGSHMQEKHIAGSRFNRFLRWNLRFKWVPLSLALVIFMASIGAYISMPKGALDAKDAGYLSIQLKYPNDVPLKVVQEKGRQLEQDLIDQEEAEIVLLQSGNSAGNAKWGNVMSATLVDYFVVVKEGADAQKLIDYVRSEQSNYEGATLTANETGFMGSSSTTEYIDIVGDDIGVLRAVAEEVTNNLKEIQGIEKLSNSMEDTKPVFTFQVDPTKGNASEIAAQLGAMLNPIPLGQIRVNEVETAVVLQPMMVPASKEDLNHIQLMTAAGPVSISELAEFKTSNEPSMLYHKDGQNYIRITAEIDPKKVSTIGADIKQANSSITLPEGVQLFAGGASVDQADDFADLGMTAVVSIILVYLIMVLTFRTLRAPLAIMFSLPLAAIGAVLGLLISGITPDFTALFGALMLIGIVVTNAIVLLDRIKHNEEHMNIREAIVEAASTRMRPILMTAIATICAMAPLVFGHSEDGNIVSQSLAIVVIGGLTVATVLTLIIVPVIYELLYFRTSAKQRKQENASAVSDTELTIEG